MLQAATTYHISRRPLEMIAPTLTSPSELQLLFWLVPFLDRDSILAQPVDHDVGLYASELCPRLSVFDKGSIFSFLRNILVVCRCAHADLVLLFQHRIQLICSFLVLLVYIIARYQRK